MTSAPIPASNNNGHLRVGTAERESALEILRNAAADDRLGFDELEGRVPRALGAVTRADLVAVLTDLLPAEQIDQMLGNVSPLGQGPGYTWDDPLVLEATGWNEVEAIGPWLVPPFIEVHASLGGARLDFSQAIARAKVIDLVLVVRNWGTVLIVVPEGWGVDTLATQAEGEGATIDSRRVRTRPQSGLPRIIVRGRTTGTVKVRYATPKDAARAQKRLDRRELPPELPFAD